MVVTVAGQTLVAPLTAIDRDACSRRRTTCDAWSAGAIPSSAVRDVFVPLIDVGDALGSGRI